ncbi:MAG: hypothetical protein IJY10_09220 [Lachnospiraceae bacterium]|nr:hypothetical protein [Lachnospiraceae bacterium]
MLYHGSNVGGLHVIKANAKSHVTGECVAYFTEDRCYALVCCRDREENFVTMGIREDGKQHYFERFPNQLKILYEGKCGYLYLRSSIDGMTKTKGHTWESKSDVWIDRCEVIQDVYLEILREEKNGNIVIHRYSEIDAAEQKMHANYIKEHLEESTENMKHFYITHFSSLWD